MTWQVSCFNVVHLLFVLKKNAMFISMAWERYTCTALTVSSVSETVSYFAHCVCFVNQPYTGRYWNLSSYDPCSVSHHEGEQLFGTSTVMPTGSENTALHQTHTRFLCWRKTALNKTVIHEVSALIKAGIVLIWTAEYHATFLVSLYRARVVADSLGE